MVDPKAVLAFGLVSFGMVCTPGPNMIYLLSRSILQGRLAGIISLVGVILGFVFYMLATAFGLTAIIIAVPVAYNVIKWAGACYLLWLAWNAVKPGAVSVLAPRDLPIDGPRRLFTMGFVTNLLNPKIAVLYISLLPQFIDPSHGHVLVQTMLLGLTQISISFTVNLLIILTAGTLSAWFRTRPQWLRVQRYFMGTILFGLAARLAFDRRA